jgi:L-lysine 2,3-aminomutase
MIPEPTPRQQAAPAWQHELRHAFHRPAELLAALDLDPALPELRLAEVDGFPLRVPRGFVARMRPGDPRDPLFLQIWPQAAETAQVAGYAADPVGDLQRLRGGCWSWPRAPAPSTAATAFAAIFPMPSNWRPATTGAKRWS